MSIVEFGPVEENVREQISNCQKAEEGSLAVLCADNHLGYSMPIGGVVAYERYVSPSAVGYDIACGNMAVRTDRLAKDIVRADAMDLIWRSLSFGVGRSNAERIDRPILDEIAECDHPAQRPLAQTAASQLGTIGSGNHYVDLFEDEEDGALWIGVHFGSRGFGHKTATWALDAAGSKGDAMMAPPTLIDVETELGALYVDGMERAGRYAYAGREWVIERVLALLGARATDSVHNHHNFAWKERHDGRDLWVHRKGATPAFPGQRGFVGGTMGDSAVILEGVESPLSRESLYSTVHGAGRVISRKKATGKMKKISRWKCQNYRRCDYTAAKGGFHKVEGGPTPKCPTCGHKLRLETFEEQLSRGLVDYAEWKRVLAGRGIEIRGGGADEAPQCYKNLAEVLNYHAGTIRVLNVLRPIGVAMAGSDVFDPFKD